MWSHICGSVYLAAYYIVRSAYSINYAVHPNILLFIKKESKLIRIQSFVLKKRMEYLVIIETQSKFLSEQNSDEWFIGNTSMLFLFLGDVRLWKGDYKPDGRDFFLFADEQIYSRFIGWVLGPIGP